MVALRNSPCATRVPPAPGRCFDRLAPRRVQRYSQSPIAAPGRVVSYPASDKTTLERFTMPWLILVLSGILETVWATALSKIAGFSKPIPIAVFIVTLTASMLGFGYAIRDLPFGTAYAVWVGIGAVGTAGYAMATGVEAFTVVKLLLLLGIVGCVIGLKLTH